MSLRLAVKRSLDDAERDDHDIRDAGAMLSALRGFSVPELKKYLHPIRKSPYIELPSSVSQKSQRIDISLLLEVLPEWLLSQLVRDDVFSTNPRHYVSELLNASSLLYNVIQLAKKEVIELEDYVDASTDIIIDIVVALSVVSLKSLFYFIENNVSYNDGAHQTLALSATAFEMISFIADLELDHHSHQQPALTALSLHSFVVEFLQASVDSLVICLDDDAVSSKTQSGSFNPTVSNFLKSVFETLEKMCLVEELLVKLLSAPGLADSQLLDAILTAFQGVSQDDAVCEAALKLLLRLSEEDQFLSSVCEGEPLKKMRQILLIVENFIINSLENGSPSALSRLLSLQIFVAFTETPQLNMTLAVGATSILLKYLAGDPEDFRATWATNQVEYVSLMRLISAVFGEDSASGTTYRSEMMTKFIGSKGKGALLKKAITSNSVYFPNILDNVSLLLLEVIGGIKWRKTVSLREALDAVKFFEDLEEALGSKHANDVELQSQLMRIKAMSTGFRNQHWRAMWHVHDFRKPITLSAPLYGRGRSSSQSSQQAQSHHHHQSSHNMNASVKSEKPPVSQTVLGPATVSTVHLSYASSDSDESISLKGGPEPDPSSASAIKNVVKKEANVKSEKEEEEDLETAAALLANSRAPTVWVKRQEQEGESEEPISVMDDLEPSSLTDFAHTVLGPATQQTTVVYESGAIDVLTGMDDNDAITPPRAQKPVKEEGSADSNDGSSYEGTGQRKRKNKVAKTAVSPPRQGTKRKAIDNLSDGASPAKKPRTPDRDASIGRPDANTLTVSDIFSGSTFRISKGVPSADHLTQLITQNGGLVLQYTTKHTTHYIATLEEYEEFGPQIQAAKKRALPIVKPEFVTDSVSAGARAEVASYLLSSPLDARRL